MSVDTSAWSGEGLFTQLLVERLPAVEGVAFVRVEDAPASRSEADYNFISNEVYVQFAVRTRVEQTRRFGILPVRKAIQDPAMTVADLEAALAAMPDVGPPDYSDEGMLQYLKTERVIPPYQTRGYKLVELVRIYTIVSGPAAA
jgi:hypothetical protein